MSESDIENSIFNFDDNLKNKDVQISPNYYIHQAIIMAQRTLLVSILKNNFQEGVIAYSTFIEHIEVLCKASGMLSEDYSDNLKSETNIKEGDSKIIIIAKESNHKLYCLMKELFSTRASTTPIKERKPKKNNEEIGDEEPLWE